MMTINSVLALFAIIILNNAVWLAFLYFSRERDSKLSREQFREFALAAKSKDVKEYAEVMPTDDPLPQEDMEDDFIDPYHMEPEKLLKAIQKRDESE